MDFYVIILINFQFDLPIPIKNSSLTFKFSCSTFRKNQNIIILINFQFYLTIGIKNS